MGMNKRLQWTAIALLGVIAFGTVGYKIVLGWSLFTSFYFTIITITTIGYGEPESMTDTGRLFTIILILSGVGTIGYALSEAARAVLQFELISTFGKRKMFKDINKLVG